LSQSVSTSEFSQGPNGERSGSVDPEQVERAKREIQSLVQEIAELSRTDAAPIDFYNAMLNKVVAALAAPGGAVWTIGANGGLQLAYQINLQQTGLIENQIGQRQHGRLLQQVLLGPDGAIVSPHSGTGDATDRDENAAANPTEFLLVLAPMRNDQGPQGVLEVFQRPGARHTTQRGYLRFLLQICELAGDFLKAGRLRHLSEKQTLWEQLETFTRTAHEKLDVRETAYTVANEGRRLIGCDRVSVAIKRGNRCPIEAVSGQDTFDKRSNVTVMLGKLAAAVVKTGEDVWFTGDTSDMAPQVEQALDAYVDESHTKAIAILTLTEPQDEEAKHAEEGEEIDPPRVIGALIVEQMVDSRTPEGFLQRVDVVRTHSATALTNALEFEGLFLMPLWRFLGKGTKLFRGRTLPKTLAVLAVAAAALSTLCFYPAELKLEGEGHLKPKVRKNVWAEVDGKVETINVEHDSKVAKGDVVLVQRSQELEEKITAVEGELHKNEAELNMAQSDLMDSKEMNDTEKSQKERDVKKFSESVKTNHEQLQLLQEKKEKLQIRSPIDGRVVTWNVKDRLLSRSVSRGDNLLEIADPTQDWELEVQMPEKRMGHIAEAASKTNGPLSVTFFLATNPSKEFTGKIEEIERSAEVRGEEGNTVLVRVAFDQQELRKAVAEPKIGASATAKVHCGQRALGYVWFHDLVDFVRAKILFRIM
jgi:multidrug efflux pump subunit AcrA (membrane-fusion protein)